MKVCKTVNIYECSATKLIQNQINKESVGCVAAHIHAELQLPCSLGSEAMACTLCTAHTVLTCGTKGHCLNTSAQTESSLICKWQCFFVHAQSVAVTEVYSLVTEDRDVFCYCFSACADQYISALDYIWMLNSCHLVSYKKEFNEL